MEQGPAVEVGLGHLGHSRCAWVIRSPAGGMSPPEINLPQHVLVLITF